VVEVGEHELTDKGVPLFATDEPASVQEISAHPLCWQPTSWRPRPSERRPPGD